MLFLLKIRFKYASYFTVFLKCYCQRICLPEKGSVDHSADAGLHKVAAVILEGHP